MQIILGLFFSFIFANFLILVYGTSTNAYHENKITVIDIIKDGYTKHFVLLILLPIITIIGVEIFNGKSILEIILYTILSLLLDKIIGKFFNIKSNIY